MSTASAIVVQANLSGSQLEWIDTGTYGTIVSRTLNIYDYTGTNLLQTVSLGTALTYTFTISADAVYIWKATIVDNTGTYNSEVDMVAYGFYTATYLSVFNGSNCGCTGGNQCNMDIAENYLKAAQRFVVASNFAAANTNIILANVFINLQQ